MPYDFDYYEQVEAVVLLAVQANRELFLQENRKPSLRCHDVKESFYELLVCIFQTLYF